MSLVDAINEEELETETKGPEIPEPLISGREAALRGFAQEFTFGFQDEIEARLKSFVSGNYEERLEAVRELNRIAEKQQPGKYKGGEYGAMVVTLLPMIGSGAGAIPAFAKVLAKFGIKNAPKIALKTAKSQVKALKNFKPSPKMSTAQKRMAKEKLQREAAQKEVNEFSKTIVKEGSEQLSKGAGMGAVMGYGKAEGDTFFEDLQEASKGAAVGGLTGVLLPFGKLALQGGKGLYTGTLARLTGLTKEQGDWIRSNKALFKGAKSLEDTQKNLIKMLNDLNAVEKKTLEKANKSLKAEQTIPKEFVTNPIDDIIEKEKERILMGNTPAIGEDVVAYFDKLEKLKDKFSKQKFGYDPDSDLVSEQNIMSLYRQLEKDAFKYTDKFSKDQNQMYAKALRQIRYQYKKLLAESNPEWNRAMEPARQIERVLGGDKTKNERGLRELFDIEKVSNEVGYDPKVTKAGKEQLVRNLKNVFGAPFVKDGMINEKVRREKLDDLQDIYTKYVEAPQAKVGVGPVKDFKTIGKVERPTLLKEGEASYMKRYSEGGQPRTGEAMIEQKFYKGAAKKGGLSEEASDMAGSVLTLLQRSLGKRLAAEAAAQKMPIVTGPAEAIAKTTEALVDRSGVLGVPRLATKEILDKDPEAQRRDQLKYILRRRRQQAQPGEKYGVDRFEGVKQVGTPSTLSFEDVIRDNNENTANTDIMKEKENEEMERKKQEFLKQQQGIKKARF